MARSYRIVDLSGERLAIAFPLVSAVFPRATLADWHAFVAPFAGDGGAGGVIGTVGEAGYLCGVLTYRREPDLTHDRVLQIDLFIALDLVERAAAVRGLVDAAEVKAAELGCRLVRIRLGDGAPRLEADLAKAGYRSDDRLLAKPLGPESAH